MLRAALTVTCCVADPSPGAEAMIDAEPIATPVTLALVTEVVAPAAKYKVAGAIAAFAGSLLDRLTNTPPAGAGPASFTAKSVLAPVPNVTLPGRIIAVDPTTVTVALALVRPGVPAVMFAEPGPTPVTGTFAVVALPGTVTEGGTDATPALSELTLMVWPPAGAGEGTVKVRFCVVVAFSVRAPGDSPSAAPELTIAWPVAEVYPKAEAVMAHTPLFKPVSTGARFGVVEPSAMKILAGETVALDASLLLSVRNMPPAGAAVPSTTTNGTDCPGGTLVDGGTMIPARDAGADTLMLAPALPKFGVLAVIVAAPAAVPLTLMDTLDVKGANSTVGGTLATAVLLELRLAVNPPAGAKPPVRVNVRVPLKPEPSVSVCGVSRLLPPLAMACTWPLPPVKPAAVALMFASPGATPLICGCTAGEVVPAAIMALAVTVAFEASLDARVTMSPPAGAGVNKLTGNAALWPTVTVIFAGTLIVAGGAIVTLTPAVAFAIPEALAVIVVEPALMPVIATEALLENGWKLTVGATEATALLLLARLTVSPAAGAAEEIVNSRFWVAAPLIAKLAGEKFIVVTGGGGAEPTCTNPVDGAKPNAEAVIVADPASAPVTTGARLVEVDPCGMKTAAGAMVTLEGSLLVSEMNMPPAGAPDPRVTGNGADWPGATLRLDGTMIADPDCAPADTVTLALALPKLGVLAVMETFPDATPVTGTLTLAVFGAKNTEAGTLATAGLLENSAAVNPLPGAVPLERIKVRLPVEFAFTVRLAGDNELTPPGAAVTCTCPLPAV